VFRICCLVLLDLTPIHVSFWRLDSLSSYNLSVFLTGSMRRLPPLNALRVFEVAARTGSYAAAGAELGLTHGAVSRQIAALESWLGQRLFVRMGRRMVATPAASAFAVEVSLSFDRVITAAEACGRLDARRILRVSAPTTFAMRWLIPRLDRFHADRAEVGADRPSRVHGRNTTPFRSSTSTTP